jgi:HK97 family phage portal protein
MALLHDFIDRWVWPISNKRGGDFNLTDLNGNAISALFDIDDYTGENITESTALKNTTVYTCVNVRGNTIASLPCNVFHEKNNKKQVLTDHRAYYLLAHEPNNYMSAANFWKTVMLHVDVWGNAYAYINRDSRRNPSSLDLWEPWKVTVTKHDGSLWYSYDGNEPVSGWDVLHYRFSSYDGIHGRSPVRENKSTIGMAMKLDRYSALLLGSRPPGVLSYEGNLTPEQRTENKKSWAAGGAGDVKILSGRWKFDPIMTPSDDASFAVARETNQRELCAIWQMPPTFVQNFNRATFANAEQMDLVYAKHTISPICRNIELENNMKLFFEREKENTYTKFNMNGLLRGDLAARQSFYQAMVNTGIMNRNEARSLEDLNPYPDGDNFLVQGAMVPADLLREKYEKELLPSVPSGTDPANIKSKLNGHHYAN